MPEPATAPLPPGPAELPAAEPERRRPAGVAILSVVAAILGALSILGGMGLAIVGPQAVSTFDLTFVTIAAAGVAFAGVTVLLVGIALVVLGWGMWQGLPWAWTLGVALLLVGLLLGVLSLPSGGLGILLGLLLLWYLTREGVERWFAKVGAWPTRPVNRVLGMLAQP